LKKHYIGSISTELKAARIYDRHAILTHGLRAKTNFSYSKAEIENILENEKDGDAFEEEFSSDKKTHDGFGADDECHSNNMVCLTIEISKQDTKPHLSETNEIVRSEDPSPKNSI
jgi:hypothetical protein